MVSSEQIKDRMAIVLSVDKSRMADDVILTNLVADSFILIDMVIDLQNTFGLRLNQEDLVGTSTVGDLIKVLLSKAN